MKALRNGVCLFTSWHGIISSVTIRNVVYVLTHEGATVVRIAEFLFVLVEIGRQSPSGETTMRCKVAPSCQHTIICCSSHCWWRFLVCLRWWCHKSTQTETIVRVGRSLLVICARECAVVENRWRYTHCISAVSAACQGRTLNDNYVRKPMLTMYSTSFFQNLHYQPLNS